MKRRDLLKGLLAIPAAIVGVKAAKAAKAEPQVLDVTNLGTPRGKKEWLMYDASTGERLVFEPVTLKLKPLTCQLYDPDGLFIGESIP